MLFILSAILCVVRAYFVTLQLYINSMLYDSFLQNMCKECFCS